MLCELDGEVDGEMGEMGEIIVEEDRDNFDIALLLVMSQGVFIDCRGLKVSALGYERLLVPFE